MDKILQDMIAVLDSIGTYGDKVREWQRHARSGAPATDNPALPAGSRPPHLGLDLPGAAADPASEAGNVALQAAEQRGLGSAKRGGKMPRII